ncbi:MAG: preprotein translocase subunit SecE [Candidatus Eremiobacteraeota bacterium]|nr:preprotein translocase subunit SecE [Candidatus Eremiobacteraeota bacterium]MBV8365790.1 preprotein translocase subunit SecE [Candidatus Eremiobacteraeota bacterium]
MKRITAPGRPVGDADAKPEIKDKEKEARAEERERQWRRIVDGYRAIVSEMKRVTWPSRDEWVSATLITIGLVVVVALWTSAISHLIEFIFKIPNA